MINFSRDLFECMFLSYVIQNKDTEKCGYSIFIQPGILWKGQRLLQSLALLPPGPQYRGQCSYPLLGESSLNACNQDNGMAY